MRKKDKFLKKLKMNLKYKQNDNTIFLEFSILDFSFAKIKKLEKTFVKVSCKLTNKQIKN